MLEKNTHFLVKHLCDIYGPNMIKYNFYRGGGNSVLEMSAWTPDYTIGSMLIMSI